MTRRLHLILLLLAAWFLPLQLLAQTNSELRSVYSQAESDYQLGRIEQAIALLEPRVNDFTGNMRQNSFRLISLCYMALDESEKAESYATLLLNENPYYTSTQDPARFEELINRLKSGRAITITTASSQTETLNEAPVPVTIITREMIDNLSNNKDLSQILAAYVPGLIEINSYASANVAMHGVYTAHQEKILIMENGHRLNARSNNMGRIDYAVSTEKIDHIEVLRGPASSLYGNVALTAVVNIITKRGAEVDGFKAKYGYGSYHTHKGDITVGTTFMGADVLAWASLYTARGKENFIPAFTGYTNTPHDGYEFIGRYDGLPSYDLGCTVAVKDFSFMFSHRNGKRVPQFSWYGEVYDYPQYRRLSGVTPGYSIEETHLDISYSKSKGNFNWLANLYGDTYKFNDYTVIADSTVQVVFNHYDGSVVMEDGKPIYQEYWGMYQNMYWQEYSLGILLRGDAMYKLGKMHGNLLAGLQAEAFNLYDTSTLLGQDYDAIVFTLPESKNMLNTGTESSFSVFVQDKHYFTPSLILNAGLRYDRKLRKGDYELNAISPRASLIYTANKNLSTKLSFSRAFVDAPYFYRQNTSNAYRGSESLQPEYLNSLQLELLGQLPRLNISYDLNLYYNHFTDIINNTQNTVITSTKYRNSGSLKMAGIELEVGYRDKKNNVRASMAAQHVIQAEDYYYSDHSIYAVPDFFGTAVYSRQLLETNSSKLSATARLSFASSTLQQAPKTRIKDSEDFTLNSRFLADIGVKFQFRKSIQLAVDCENLFNHHYFVGGTHYFPYQRPGRTFMATLSLKY